MFSKRILHANCCPQPLLISLLLLHVLSAAVLGHQFAEFSAVENLYNVRRAVREANDAASSSINAEEDLAGLNTGWLTDGQLSELASAGGNEKRMKKLRDFYDNLEGDARKGATDKIMGECYGWLEDVASEDERNALKKMHQQNHGECKTKIGELLGRLSEERREQVEKRMAFCEHVWYGGTMDTEGDSPRGANGDEHNHHHDDNDDNDEHQHKHNHHDDDNDEHHEEHHHKHGKRWAYRQRRDHHHGEHGLEDYFKSHLAWLTDDQKAELRTMKQNGKSRTELKQTVTEWYEATTGDARERATEMLKGGCRELIKLVLGEDKANKIKEMKESGSDLAKISEQINAWIDEVADSKKKELANEYRGVCAKIFGAKVQSGGRKRRNWHGRQHNLQQRIQPKEEDEGEVHLEDEDERHAEDAYEVQGEHLRHHNSWLSRRQKQMLKRLRDQGHEEHELHERIHDFYDVSPEEVKATARGILQKGCESVLKRIFGEYKAEEIIQMRDDGAPNGEIEDKITEALNQIRSPQKREEAGRFAMSCRRIFAMIERRRRRSAEKAAEHYSLEAMFKSHLEWLNEPQREELKLMKSTGKGKTEMQQKVMKWYGQLQGQSKEEARQHLINGCRELLANVLGKENADQLKRLREGGMREAELEVKADEMVATIQEEEKKMKAKEFGTVCRKLLLEGN